MLHPTGLMFNDDTGAYAGVFQETIAASFLMVISSG